ncbi:MAG: UDP-N-acetylmuramoyl-L-alanyl-D-glutamate--2,6-diaminopimelate ligase [Candidatus Hydrogenedentes bacterium]|nr:UDP-N-acetylmuramoyl-L-alanyl-D-glutamate--2,6-diaminopimelate ligase [Candidatus Hydrogenedentota bacterium]
MILKQLLRRLGCNTDASPGVEIRAVTEDSRRVGPGSLFVAAPGERVDGHAFAEQAVTAGAVAVLGDRTGITSIAGAPYIHVAHPRRALGIAAHALAGDPTDEMTVIGVTGTNGKSSIVTMASHILNAGARPSACFGTLGYRIDDETIPAPHTTPFGEDLAALFLRAKEAGARYVAMEVSSHALEQERVAGIHFRAGAFTNLTQDHLDYHHDMETYCRAKLRLFERIEGADAFTVVNADDPSSSRFVSASRVRCITYGGAGDCRAEKVRMELQGTRFSAVTPWGTAELSMKLLGAHNVSNAMCALAICGGCGLSLTEIATAFTTLPSVPGRFEHVDAGQDFQVIVDYAHTEDGLRNVLRAARDLCKGRVILVFGCGGDRDRTKRPKMAAAAAELADFSIITSDNPRSENPDLILLDIESGMQFAGMKKDDSYTLICDRTEAIRRAITMARAGDLVMIAGKGHETYQILGSQRIHFDDREVARAILGER